MLSPDLHRARLPRVRTLLAALLLGLLGASCASTGAHASRVTLRDYRSAQGQRDFELVDKESGDELEYYSTARRNAPRKYIEGDIMEALSEYLHSHGFAANGQEGAAPRRGDGQGRLRFAFEWETSEGVRHWPMGDPTGDAMNAEWKEFLGCQQMFLELYNSTSSYQAIQNASGKDIFEEERRRLIEERNSSKLSGGRS